MFVLILDPHLTSVVNRADNLRPVEEIVGGWWLTFHCICKLLDLVGCLDRHLVSLVVLALLY